MEVRPSVLWNRFQIRYNAVFGYPNTLLSFKGAHHITISKNYLNASPYHDSPDRKSLETSAINVLDNTDSIIYEANRFIGFRGRPKSEFIDTTDAANFNSDNPNFDAQFFNKAWQLDAINVNSSLAKYSFGESIPNRSLTTIALSGAGYIVGGATQDKLTFINVPMVEQGAIYMKITDLQVPDSTSFGRGGLMIRETKEVSSTFSMISVRELGNSMYLQHIFRNGRGNNLKAGKTSAAITLPIWLALKRQGNIFSSYHSDDGEAWHLFYQNIMEMGSTYDIGIAVSSQDDNLVTKLKGDEVLVDTDLKYHISLSGGSSICATGTEDNCVLLGCIWKNNKCTSCSTSIENEDNCLNAGCNWKASKADSCQSCNIGIDEADCQSISCVWKEVKEIGKMCTPCSAITVKHRCKKSRCVWQRGKCASCRAMTTKKKCIRNKCSWNNNDRCFRRFE